MSFEAFPVWIPRCDGDTTHGQCPERLHWSDHEDRDDPEDLAEDDRTPDLRPVLYTRSVSDQTARDDLRASGWLALPSDRFLCPRHVWALEYLPRAEIDGLPLPTGDQP